MLGLPLKLNSKLLHTKHTFNVQVLENAFNLYMLHLFYPIKSDALDPLARHSLLSMINNC